MDKSPLDQFKQAANDDTNQKIQQASVAPILACALEKFIPTGNITDSLPLLTKLFNEPIEVVSYKLTHIMALKTASLDIDNLKADGILSQLTLELIQYFQKSFLDLQPL